MKSTFLCVCSLLYAGTTVVFAEAPAIGSSPATETGKVKVATCQFPTSADIRANAKYIRNQMREAHKKGADIAQFAEAALPGAVGRKLDFPSMEGFDWDLLRTELKTIIDLAGELKLWVILGSYHRLQNHNPHNSLYVINPEGKIVDRYDKRFCSGPEECEQFTPGDHFVTFEVNGVKCGMLICYDIRFPELYREYKKLGVQLMFHSFWNGRKKEKNNLLSIIMPAQAQAFGAVNYMWVSITNATNPYSWAGKLINPEGRIVAELPLDQPAVMVNVVDTTYPFYDASKPFRDDAMKGILNSAGGQSVDDPRSKDRTSY